MNKEKTNYAKLIKLIILNNKTLFMLFQIAVIIGITFLFSIVSLSETIVQTKIENAVETYGKFLIVMPNVDDSLLEDIKRQNPSFQYNSFGIGGNVEHSDKKITYGSMKETMSATFGFQLLEGKWPNNSNQIVMEDYVAHIFGIQDQALPVSIPLTIDGQTTQYDVTGIISNYSYLLAAPCNSNLETKSYPSIIFDKGQLKHETNSLVILQKKLKPKRFSYDIDSILIKEYIEELDNNNICANDQLQFHGYDAMHDMIAMEQIYRLLLNVLLIFVFIIMIKVILTNSKKTLSIFEAIGLSKKKKQLLILGILCSILLIGLLMGGLLSFLFGFLYMHKTFFGYSSYYLCSLVKNIILECVIIIMILIVSTFLYKYNWNKSIIHGLNSTYRNPENQKYKFKKIDFYIIIMQAVCLFFIIASMNFAEMFKFQEKEVTYDLYSKQVEASLPINGFYYVKDTHEFFDFHDIDTLKSYGNNVALQMEAETKKSSILIEKDHTDEYWKTFCTNENSKLTPEKNLIWNQVSSDASKYNTIKASNTQIIILPQKEFHNFLQLHEIPNAKLEKNQERACILLLPRYEEDNPDASIKKGGDILLGRIENKNNQPSFITETFSVKEILSYTEESNRIKIVINEEVAKKSKLILGYDKINIKLSSNSSPSVQRELEEKIAFLMASVQGGMLDSSVSRNQNNTLMDRYSSLLSNSLVFFCILSICLYILMNHYIEWKNNKFEYGVLRSFGMSYFTLQHKLFIRYMNCTLLASIIALIAGYKAFPDGSITIKQIVISLAIMFSVTYFCRIIAYYLNRNKPICSMLIKS